MKTIKSILIAATLICATTVSAQEAPKHEFKVAIGDSVMIKRECIKYCTSERPSVWVWDKVHTVRQLGTKRFPDGVLLMNIYSWMCEECLIPVSHKAEEKAEPVEEVKPEEEAPVEEVKPEEPKPAPIEEEEHETPKGDEIKSEQHFKHNYDRFTIGVRGGASSLLHHVQKDFSLTNDANWQCGFDAMLDLQYAHYWAKDGRPVDLGLIVGLGIGYAQSALKTSQWDYLPDYKSSGLDYLILANNIRETDRQIQLEVPIMFSLIHDCGFFFNVGPRFMLPVYTPFKQTINPATTTIAAYNGETGVTMVDNPVTGQYKGEQPKEGNDLQWKINIMLTAELGYEWILKSGNSLGLGVYADYCVYNSRKVLDSAKRASLLDISNPPSTGGTANVSVFAATDTYASRVGYFDAGIKLAYHFNWPKKKASREVKLF